jgi:hypothetical protein
MSIDTYDAGLLGVFFGDDILSGFGEDTAVEVSRDEDAISTKVGVDGRGAIARNRNRSGTVKVTLLQTSASNDVLSANLVRAEMGDPSSTKPLQVSDGSGRTLIHAQNAVIKKVADVKLGKGIEAREWTFWSDDLEIFVGGNF